MSSIALKFSSLAIRTLSKPIANYIKRQAREHPGFRKTCVSFAQGLHQLDMRWRIGLLHDAAAFERQAQRDAAREAAKKKKSSVTTVKTEEQAKAEEEAASNAKKAEDAAEDAEKHRPPPKIKPLSETKAIETGANFISETFLFAVAAGLILFETFRSRRKDEKRRDVVKDRLDDLEESERAARAALIELEKEVLQLRAKHPEISQQVPKRILPDEVYNSPVDENNQTDEVSKGWLSRMAEYISTKEDKSPKPDEKELGPAARILAESDRKLDERHRQQAAEDAAAEAAEQNSKTKK